MDYQILVVDDDAASRVIYKQILKAPGVEFIEANDGEQALQHLQRHAPHLVVLDMHLPRVHGSQVLNYIYAADHLTETRVLVLTAHDGYHSLSLRAQDHLLLKPVLPRHVRDIAAQLLTPAS